MLIFETVEKPIIAKAKNVALEEAVVEIIVGQMLSGAAADTIYRRLQCLATERSLLGTYQLSMEALRAAGVSSFKAKAISEFAVTFEQDPERFKSWSTLSYDELVIDVSKLWGLSNWSASILALSHFGMIDVWPAEDGSIQRAVKRVRANLDPDFDHVKGSPYRSYLARYFWAALDNAVI